MFSNKVEVYLEVILHDGVVLLSKKGRSSGCHELLSEVFKHLDHILQPVHAVPKDNPVPDVSVRRVSYVTQFVPHNLSGDILMLVHTALPHGRLDFTQRLQHVTQIIR
jgi:hypothetical protein